MLASLRDFKLSFDVVRNFNELVLFAPALLFFSIFLAGDVLARGNSIRLLLQALNAGSWLWVINLGISYWLVAPAIFQWLWRRLQGRHPSHESTQLELQRLGRESPQS